jgi:hypothetical protein
MDIYESIQISIIKTRLALSEKTSKVVPDQDEVEKELEIQHPEIHIHGVNKLLVQG